MLKIGTVTLGGVPRVVFGVDRDSRAVAQAAREGVDLLELRVDRFDGPRTPQAVARQAQALKRHRLPLIGTIRGPREGGNARMADAERAALYRALCPLVDAVDLDLRAPFVKPVLAEARRHRNTVILSYHDFHTTPSEAVLRRIIARAAALGADVIKIATFANAERDVLNLFQFTLAHRRQRLVTMAMGPIGSVSRVLLPLAGSLMTYTNVSPSDGQIEAARLIADLRLYYPRYHDALIARLG